MTGLGRPPRIDLLLQIKNKLTRSHRTRPPPADTRRACCHVLSSFQRTGRARSLACGIATVDRRTFQIYRTLLFVSSLFLAPARKTESDASQSVTESTLGLCSLGPIFSGIGFAQRLGGPAAETVRRRSSRGSCCPLVEPGGLSNGKVEVRSVFWDLMALRPPCAPVTLRRAKRIYGGATTVSTGNVRAPRRYRVTSRERARIWLITRGLRPGSRFAARPQPGSIWA